MPSADSGDSKDVLVHRGYRYELDPNNHQRTLLMKHAGCARFAYNWGLEERIKRFNLEEGKDRFTNYFRQHQELNQRKRSHYPWMYEVSKCAPQEALRDLHKAFANFWRGRKKGKKVGFPKFKKRDVMIVSNYWVQSDYLKNQFNFLG